MMKSKTSSFNLTQQLLLAGVVIAPLFYGVFILQMLTREGFDITKHPISALALGDMGWIQTANFLVAGVLALILAFGLQRALVGGKASVWGPILTALFGVGIIIAGIFATDPAFGFPAGAPEGRPTTMSMHAGVHSFGFYTAFTMLIGACFVFARKFSGEQDQAWARLSMAAGIITPVLIALGMSALSNLAGLCFAIAGLIAMGWLSATAYRLRNKLS